MTTCNRPKGHLPPHEHVLFDYMNPCGAEIGQPKEAEGTWRPVKATYGGVPYLAVQTGEQVEPLQRLPEWMIDAIISDHNAATAPKVDVAALERELADREQLGARIIEGKDRRLADKEQEIETLRAALHMIDDAEDMHPVSFANRHGFQPHKWELQKRRRAALTDNAKSAEESE